MNHNNRPCRDTNLSLQQAIDFLVVRGHSVDQVEQALLNGEIREALGRVPTTAADRRMIKAEIAIYKRNHP